MSSHNMQHRFIKERISCSIQEREKMLSDEQLMQHLEQAASLLLETYRNLQHVFIAGNGGSAADAQHFAAEMVGRFQRERPGLFAVALTVDTSALTAIGNDYGFESIFSRQLEALGREGDLFIGISTSGNSPNILKALAVARTRGIRTIALTGADGGHARQHSDLLLAVPASVTARVQECHILVLHVLCEIVEDILFSPGLVLDTTETP